MKNSQVLLLSDYRPRLRPISDPATQTQVLEFRHTPHVAPAKYGWGLALSIVLWGAVILTWEVLR